MRRRHLLALVILALVVATVLAVGPVRVWDWLTTTNEEMRYTDDGTLHRHHRVRLWSDEWVGTHWEWVRDSATTVIRHDGSGLSWHFSEDRKLMQVDFPPGVDAHLTVTSLEGEQSLYLNGDRVETRTSPPWFTEEEILQSVEGVEE